MVAPWDWRRAVAMGGMAMSETSKLVFRGRGPWWVAVALSATGSEEGGARQSNG